MIIFSALILLGLFVSNRSIRMRKIVTVIYTFVLLWYTLLRRLLVFTSIPVAADSTITTTPITELSFTERLIETVIAIFGSQTDGTLAGGGVGPSLVFNILLFIPCGYLTAMWLLQLVQIRSEKRDKQTNRDRGEKGSAAELPLWQSAQW